MKMSRTNSVILSTAARYVLPLLILFSVFILLRGHNHPGGGFIGGLVAAAAFALYAIAFDVRSARDVLRINPRRLIGIGLAISISSVILPLLVGQSLMTGLWIEQEIPVLGHIGTPSMFDFGLALVVVGVALTVIFNLAETDEEERL